MKASLRFSLLFGGAFQLVLSSGSHAETIYWNGETGASWATTSAWSTVANAFTPDPSAAPGIADDVVFNIDSVNANQTIGLGGANQFARSLAFGSTGSVLLGGGGNRDLTLGGGGVTVASGAGASFVSNPVTAIATIGSSSPNLNVFVRISENQTWTNNSAYQLRVVNAASAANTGTTPVTLTIRNTGVGTTAFNNQLNNGAGGAVLSLVIDSSGSGATTIAGGNYSGNTYVRQGVLSSNGSFGVGTVLLGDSQIVGDSRINTSGITTNAITVAAGTGLRALTGTTGGDFQGNITLHRDVSLGTVSTSGQTVLFSGAISGQGNVAVGRIGSGTSSPIVILSGQNTYSGKTSVDSATLVVNSLNRVVGGTASSSLGAPTTVANGTISLGSVASSTLRYAGTGETTDRVIDLAGATIGVTLEQAGSGHLLFSSNLSTSGNGNKSLTFRGATAGTGEFGGIIANSTGSTGIAKLDSGSWRLSGLNTYTGVTSLNGGVLEVTKLADGGVVSSIGASANINSNLSFGGSGPAATLRYVGAGDSTNRSFNVGGAGAVFDASGTGAINFTSAAVPSHSSNDVARTVTFTGTSAAANTMSARLGNGNSLGLTSVVKSGTGSWVLAGANTYTGETQVTAGKLSVKTGASLAAGSAVTVTGGEFNVDGVVGGAVSVSAGARLSGVGTIQAATTISGIHATGNGVGLQTFSNGLHYAENSVFEWELKANKDSNTLGVRGLDYDAVNITGNLVADSNAIFRVTLAGANLAEGFWESNRTWTNIFSKGFDTGGFNTAKIQVYDGGSLISTSDQGTFSITGGTLSWTAIPEPSISLLTGLSLMAVLRRRRAGGGIA